MDAWPALSETFGIHPWDIREGRISGAELLSYMNALRRRADEYRRAEAESMRRR